MSSSLVPRLSCVSEEKKSLVHTVWACSVPYNLLHYTNPCDACRLLSYERCLSLTIFCEDDDEGATKLLGCLLAELVRAFVHSKNRRGT